ncbi:MAG: S8 family serine peptidase, partial [Planctomycetota bacterium]
MIVRANRIIQTLIVVLVLLTTPPTFAGSMNYVDKGTKDLEKHHDYASEEIIIKFKEPTASTIGENTFDDPDVAKLDLSVSLGKLNKKFRLSGVKRLFKNFKANKERTKALLKKDKTLLTKREKHILQRLKRAPEKATVPALDRIYKLKFDLEPDESIQDVLTAYNNDPSVEYAELNYIVTIDSIPNDPYFSFQWSLHNTGQMYPESGKYNHPPGKFDADIDAPEAWDIHTGSSEVIVAVVDSGVDYNHRDLQPNIWINSGEIPGNGIDDDRNGYIDDIYGYDFINNDGDPYDDGAHGTHCAGTIAAEGDNGLDIAGVCWNAKIMALKFLGSGGSGKTSDALTAFYYAVENGADVTSNSWGGGSYSNAMKEAIDYAHSQGVIMVASAGNKNRDYPQYPAYYDHMISVAATNSNDEKATFSNYGDWVDIAAPGVDILSLRAENTSKGTVYDDYTTIMSGTSMACPHVSGACALLLAAFSKITVDEVSDILRQSADPIEAGICQSGRLNIFEALLAIPQPKGVIRLDQEAYTCLSNINVWLYDSDLKNKGTQEVTLTTSGGDLETIALIQTPPSIGIFSGTIPTNSADPNIEDGVLQIMHGQIITASYEDAKKGPGNPAVAVDTATADCQGPVIFNVQIDIPGPEPTVTFETNEPSKARVWCGLSCEDPNLIIRSNSTLSTYHSIKLFGISPQTRYFFIIEATDSVGNTTFDNNEGQCYNFTTTAPGVIKVPADYQTIQEAIDRSWNSGTVRVADSSYTGYGNRDIDFKGKAITVRSENGPENCVVDCDGTSTGFYFHNSEGPNSVLDGFTITGGSGRYVSGSVRHGGGIYCYKSSPVIKNCVVTNNTAGYGGGITCGGGSATITDCTIKSNSSHRGGGIYTFSNATISNCIIINNYARLDGGGGVYGSKLRITNCLIAENSTGRTSHGGGVTAHFTSGDNIITNCTVVNNSAGDVYGRGGGITNYRSDTTITNCIVRGNSAKYGNQISMGGATANVSYCNVQGGESAVYVDNGRLTWGPGNIDADPSFVNGPEGDHFLSQITAGQAIHSPCVDVGSDLAANLGMDICTTRTDQIGDAGIVDM